MDTVWAQGFSLCSVVDAKQKKMTLAWNQPGKDISGYSFQYNGQELTPHRPTIDDGRKLVYEASLGLGKHSFLVNGYETAYLTNEVVVQLKRPRYLAALIPGFYQAVHRNRYASSCGNSRRLLASALGVAEPVILMAATGYATALWFRFFAHKNAALNARDTFVTTLNGDEYDLWQAERGKADDVFKRALTVSVATAAAHAISTLFFSPRVRARINGGFQLDCNKHPGGMNLCVKL